MEKDKEIIRCMVITAWSKLKKIKIRRLITRESIQPRSAIEVLCLLTLKTNMA
jgi:hypothetical protein